MYRFHFFTLLFLIGLPLHTSAQKTGNKLRMEERKELQHYFSDYGYDGSVIIYDLQKNKYICSNKARNGKRFSPASTFKIFNSLVALETGVATDSSFTIPWDGVQRSFPNWNRDQSLRSAFANSAVWYYQELARRIGAERMKRYLEQEQYGNMDISGGIDIFWLESSLLISQEEQIRFLKKLYMGQLSAFSKRSMNIVKDIMLTGDTSQYRLRAKTGSVLQDSLYQGWYTGWIEKEGNVYFFATHFEADNDGFATHGPRIKEITLNILKELSLIEKIQ